VPLLLGLGLDQLSTNALAVPQVKQVIRLASRRKWRKLAKQALEYPTAAEVTRFMDRELANGISRALFGLQKVRWPWVMESSW
jgi:phosphotransferase system enzyme I (PtsI)